MFNMSDDFLEYFSSMKLFPSKIDYYGRTIMKKLCFVVWAASSLSPLANIKHGPISMIQQRIRLSNKSVAEKVGNEILARQIFCFLSKTI